MNMIIELDDLDLFRSDPINPGSEWSTSYKQPRYSFPDLGFKNAANLYFFSNSSEIAINLEIESPRPIYLTTCKIVEKVRLFDLTKYNRIVHVLQSFEDHGMQIFGNEFHLYDDDDINMTFDLRFKEPFENLREIDPSDLITNAKQILDFSNSIKFNNISVQDEVSVFGQRLTDFDNGNKFKRILLEAELDGYRWQEGDSFGITYCLINNNKISKPKCCEVY